MICESIGQRYLIVMRDEIIRHRVSVDAKGVIRAYSANKMEMKMHLKIITVLAVPMLAAIAAQAAAASDHRHTRMKERAVVCEQLRKSNAYATPGHIVAQPDWSSYANGAMASGIAGH
jgi:hypothetical protein